MKITWNAETKRQLLAVVERGTRRRWWRREGTIRGGFRYVDAEGNRITDEGKLDRIKALVIPPAWRLVRIAPARNSRLQAVGVDTSGRVQYLYHARFAERRQRQKYEKIERFGEKLPEIRRAVTEHLGLPGLPKEKVLAAMVHLINDLYFRLGSEASVERYRTYGITTLRNKHLEIRPGGCLLFSFVGKHHVKHRKVLVDEQLADVMAEIKALPGSRLFNYVDADGKVKPVKPSDVNAYIKQACGPEYSAKDFRTWGGTLHAAVALAEAGPVEGERAVKKTLTQVCRDVSERLGNTPAVCRSSYIHPTVFDCYQRGITIKEFRQRAQRVVRRSKPEYEPEEVALLKLFQEASPGAKSTTPTDVVPRELPLAA